VKAAALGFRIHSGWCAMVAVSLEKTAPQVLARSRPHLVATFTYEFRQPYHTAEFMPLSEASTFIDKVRSEATRLAGEAIHSARVELKRQGYTLASAGLLLASGKPLPSLEKILASHALIHTADGELFREAIAHACRVHNLALHSIQERDLLSIGSRLLRSPSAALLRRLAVLGKPLGPPWSQDEKFAALAAWLALRSHGKK